MTNFDHSTIFGIHYWHLFKMPNFLFFRFIPWFLETEDKFLLNILQKKISSRLCLSIIIKARQRESCQRWVRSVSLPALFRKNANSLCLFQTLQYLQWGREKWKKQRKIKRGIFDSMEVIKWASVIKKTFEERPGYFISNLRSSKLSQDKF